MSAQKRSFSTKYLIRLRSRGRCDSDGCRLLLQQQAKAKPNLVFKEAPKPGVVAKINGQEITEEQLIGDDRLDFFDLKKREYDLKMERLNKLMVDVIIGGEAKKAGMSRKTTSTKRSSAATSKSPRASTRNSLRRSTFRKLRSMTRSKSASTLI